MSLLITGQLTSSGQRVQTSHTVQVCVDVCVKYMCGRLAALCPFIACVSAHVRVSPHTHVFVYIFF